MDLVATDGQSKGGWPFSGGVRPAGDGRRPHLCERGQLGYAFTSGVEHVYPPTSLLASAKAEPDSLNMAKGISLQK